MVAASGLTMNGEQAEIGGALVNEGTLAIAKGVFKGDVAKSGVDGYTFGSGPLVGARGFDRRRHRQLRQGPSSASRA